MNLLNPTLRSHGDSSLLTLASTFVHVLLRSGWPASRHFHDISRTTSFTRTLRWTFNPHFDEVLMHHFPRFDEKFSRSTNSFGSIVIIFSCTAPIHRAATATALLLTPYPYAPFCPSTYAAPSGPNAATCYVASSSRHPPTHNTSDTATTTCTSAHFPGLMFPTAAPSPDSPQPTPQPSSAQPPTSIPSATSTLCCRRSSHSCRPTTYYSHVGSPPRRFKHHRPRHCTS